MLSPPILILTQGHAGDRLGARLVPALREAFPDRDLLGAGGTGMQAQGVGVLARTDRLSAMGYSGLLPIVLPGLRALFQLVAGIRRQPPDLVIAVDFWQPLRVLHARAPLLREVPHLCYLPPAPNFIGPARVHGAVAKAFAGIVTPFPHQERLYREAGGQVQMGGHAGLQSMLEEVRPRALDERENLLALLPGSRSLEVRHGLPVQYEAAQEILRRYPELTPVVGCASEAVESWSRRRFPSLETTRNGRDLMARARFGLICSGTAVLEAAVLGCPGVVTYHGSALQRIEWERFHEANLKRLRADGIASPYVALPNIMGGRELYPEIIDTPAAPIAEAALRGLAADPVEQRAALDGVSEMLSWEDAGRVVTGIARGILKRDS